jgi:hypothetical protein
MSRDGSPGTFCNDAGPAGHFLYIQNKTMLYHFFGDPAWFSYDPGRVHLLLPEKFQIFPL